MNEFGFAGLFQPYQSGWEANSCGVDLHDNPYSEGSRWYAEWVDGWEAAARCTECVS